MENTTTPINPNAIAEQPILTEQNTTTLPVTPQNIDPSTPSGRPTYTRTVIIILIFITVLVLGIYVAIKDNTNTSTISNSKDIAPEPTQASIDSAPSTTQTPILATQESGYFIHKDTKEGFSIELPNNFLVKEDQTDRDDLVFLANNKKGSQAYSIGVAISVENTTQSESSILADLSSSNVGDGFKVDRDYKVVKGTNTVGVLESSGVTPGTTKELSRVSALYIGNGKLYMVSSVTDKVGWEAGKDMMTRLVLSFTLE